MKKLIEIQNDKEELRKIFDNNEKLINDVEEDMEENEIFWIRQYMKEIDGSCDYEFGFYGTNYITIYDGEYENFVSGCLEIQKSFEIFENSTKENYYTNLMKKILEKFDVLYDMSYDNKQYENLELWLNRKSEEIKNKLLYKINMLTTGYSKDEVFNYFEEFYIGERMEIEDFSYNEKTYELFEHIEYEKSYK